jgi:hypothetical protein
MKTLDVLVALFAAFMLFRHVPRALALLRGRSQGPRAMAMVSIVNVALAVALLVFSLRGLVSGLASR